MPTIMPTPDNVSSVRPVRTQLLVNRVDRSIIARRKAMLVAAYLISLLWNVSSPIRAWTLSRYDLRGGEVSINGAISWTSFLDHGHAAAIYSTASIELDLPPDYPMRLINVFIDFMQAKKASHWAKYVNRDHEDVMNGRWCRSSMRYQGKEQLKRLQDFAETGMDFYGKTLYAYVDEEEHCAVSEVSEAMLCLKGYNASDLINLNWKTQLDPSEPTVHDALAMFQRYLLPDLEDCLARRSLLMSSLGRDDGFQRLVTEITANYSLDPRNRAGTIPITVPITHYEGYIDVSGRRSAVRNMQINGNFPNAWPESGVSALTGLREVLWACSGNTRPANTTDFYSCLDTVSLVYPGFSMVGLPFSYQGREHPPMSTVGHRYIETGRVGKITRYRYAFNGSDNAPLEYLPLSDITFSTGTETAYRDDVDHPLLKRLLGDRIDWERRTEFMAERCWVQDGCFDQCRGVNASNGLDITLAYRDAGGCHSKQLTHAVNYGGFVNESCYGLGRGNASIMWTFHPGVVGHKTNLTHFVLNGTANPIDIFACIIGGRVPTQYNAPLTIDLVNAYESMVNVLLMQTFARGTEEIFLNSFALVGLAGSILFAGAYIRHNVSLLMELHRIMHQMPLSNTIREDLLISFLSANHCVCVWERFHSFFRAFSFVGILAWYVGTTKTGCTWLVDGQDLWGTNMTALLGTTEPVYRCSAGNAARPFGSLYEFLQLLAVSYTVFILVFRGPSVRGLTRSFVGLSCGFVLMGVLPTIAVTTAITAINHHRVTNWTIESIHNQFFVAMMWLCALLLMRFSRSAIVRLMARLVFDKVGIRSQPLQHTGIIMNLLGGDTMFVSSHDYHPTPTQYIPLSVLLEASQFHLRDVQLMTQSYKYVSREDEKPAPHTGPPQGPRSTDTRAREFIVQFGLLNCNHGLRHRDSSVYST